MMRHTEQRADSGWAGGCLQEATPLGGAGDHGVSPGHGRTPLGHHAAPHPPHSAPKEYSWLSRVLRKQCSAHITATIPDTFKSSQNPHILGLGMNDFFALSFCFHL